MTRGDAILEQKFHDVYVAIQQLRDCKLLPYVEPYIVSTIIGGKVSTNVGDCIFVQDFEDFKRKHRHDYDNHHVRFEANVVKAVDEYRRTEALIHCALERINRGS